MRRQWILITCISSIVAATLFLWLSYAVPFAPSLVVRISPFTVAVIKAMAHGSVDEEVFYNRVEGWGPDRVESCYALLEHTLDGEQWSWAIIAIGHAGAKADLARIQNLLAAKKLTIKQEEAAAIAISVLKDRHRHP